jgi:hypothetical protein
MSLRRPFVGRKFNTAAHHCQRVGICGTGWIEIRLESLTQPEITPGCYKEFKMLVLWTSSSNSPPTMDA